MHMPDTSYDVSPSNETELLGKRAFGTTDPDYVSLPDTKRLKLLEERGEEELCERVIKVVEKEFYTEIVETEQQIEDIDNKLLKVQQYMHTLRYLSALDFFALDKIKLETDKSSEPQKLLQDNHPAVRRYKTKTTNSNQPVQDSGMVLCKELPTSQNLSSKSVTSQGEESKNKNSLISTSSSSLSKKIIPKQPESKAVISQGRKGRLQKKVRVVVGNTYQYLQDAHENGNQLKFKWRVYVRGPPENQDISSFVSSVAFTLDKSYAPHDVIKICEFPFTVSRRGWGEFKVHLELRFHDQRNKPVKLLHSLRLSRHNDPLALTGLWRLGEETWYDVWLYDKNENQTDVPKTQKISSEDYAKQLIESLHSSGIKTETVYSDQEGNLTLSHNQNLEASIESENNLENCQVVKVSEALSSMKKRLETEDESPKSLNSFNGISKFILNKTTVSNNCDQKVSGVNTIKKNLCENIDKNGKNLCKILIRRADGKLVSCMVPKEMYEMALKLSADKNQKTNVTKMQPLIEPPNAPNIKKMQPSAQNNSTTLIENNVNPNHSLANVKRSIALNCVANNNNIMPLNSKRIVFKQNNNVSNNIKHSVIRMQTSNRLNNLSIKQPSQALTLRVSSPIHGPIRLQTINNFTQLPIQTQHSMSNLCLNSSVPIKIPTNTSVSPNTPSKNIRVLQTPDGCKFLVTSNILSSKVMADNTNNKNSIVKQEVTTGNKVPSQLLPGIRQIYNGTPAMLNNKILCTFPTNNINAGIITLPSVLNADQFTSKLSSPSSLKVSPVITCKQQSSVFNIKPSSNVMLSTPNNSDSSKKIFVTAASKLVTIKEAIGKSQFNTSTNDKKPSKQTKSSSHQKLPEKAKNEGGFKDIYLRKVKHLKMMSTSCSSEEEILRLFLKGLPIIREKTPTGESQEEVSMFCESSVENYCRLPLGRQRAIECWRAREIQKVLKSLRLLNGKFWNSKKIVYWARKHGFTPLTSKGTFRNDLSHADLRNENRTSSSSLSVVDNIGDLEKGARTTCGTFNEEDSFVIVDLEDNDVELINEPTVKVEKGLPEEQEVIEVPPSHSADGCHFVDLISSQLRIKLPPEEATPGVKMEIAKNVMWKATLSLMEDLLRSSYSAALDEKLKASAEPNSKVPSSLSTVSSNPPSNSIVNYDITNDPVIIRPKHLQMAVIRGRPEFDLFSSSGLGKYIEPRLPVPHKSPFKRSKFN